MSQPYWITPAGSLGTIPEGVFFEIQLEAVDPIAVITPTIVQPTGGIATFRFATQTTIKFPLGTSVVLAGFVPEVYNGTYEVVRTSTSSIGLVNYSIEPVTTFGTITSVPVDVTYEVVAGQLPAGFAINEYGRIAGLGDTTLGGVAADVAIDTTSRFAIRARNGSSLADRTFSVTVAVLNQPYFVTPPGNLGVFVTGDQIVDLAVDVYNPDIYGVTIVRLVDGALPPGLNISTAGIISGVIGTQIESNVTYNFTLEVTDGQASNLREFDIFVYARQIMTADNDQPFGEPYRLSGDNTYITADIYNFSTPVMLTPAGSIGSVRTGNFFAFQFTAVDPNIPERPYEFINYADNLPPGLTLDPASGWLYGLIPAGAVNVTTYRFIVQVRDAIDTFLVSTPYTYSLTVNGPVLTDVVWITPPDLGSILNGSTSTLYVEAVSVSGLTLQYQLAGIALGDIPVFNSLPQGLQLLPSGHIAGRVSFDTFALDGGTTTFDRRTTTFDLTFTFTVNAVSTNNLVNAFQTFTIRVIRAYEQPYDNLYIQAMPPLDDRALLNSLLQNDQIFPPALIYRYDDLNFGVARNVIYNHAYGLTAATIDEYITSLNLNHYWKNLILGELKTAQALDDLGNVIYEVVYSQIIDNLINNSGQSVGKSVELPYVVDTGLGLTQTVYPNSLTNMRDQVIDTVGQTSAMLPRWMLSKQADGSVLGFTPAWVIAYTVPGQSGQIAYNIQTQFGIDRLNQVDFEVDRYELDNLLTKNWNRPEETWQYVETTFVDITNIESNISTVTISYSPRQFAPFTGDIATLENVIPASYNGTYTIVSCTTTEVVIVSTNTDTYTPATVWSPTASYNTDDLVTYFDTQFVCLVANTGEYPLPINPDPASQYWLAVRTPTVSALYTSTEPSLTTFDFSIDDASWINSLNPALILPWVNEENNIVGWGYGTPPGTTFDAGSLQFIAPVDMYTNTNAYDLYLAFPRRDVITPVGTLPLNFIPWTEDGSTLTWIDDETGSGPISWTTLDP